MTKHLVAPAVRIRQIVKADHADILALDNLANPDEPLSRVRLEVFLHQPTAFGYVGTVGGAIAGYAMFDRWEKSTLALATVATHPQFQRCGVASGIVGKVVGDAFARSVTKVEAFVHEYSLAGQLLLKSLGFVCDPGATLYLGEDEVWYFSKEWNN